MFFDSLSAECLSVSREWETMNSDEGGRVGEEEAGE